ncbi:unnamed protein product [Camellia sinensis]
MVLLTEFRSLPPLFEETPNAVEELTLARDIYEHAVVLSVKIEDQDAFERDFFHGIYIDSLCRTELLNSTLKLELLSASAVENNCIKHAVELEQSFMEGAYNHVLSARQTVRHETYIYFMDLLAKTVREHPEWELKNGFVIFQKAKESAPCKEIQSLQLINQTDSYVRELERIV